MLHLVHETIIDWQPLFFCPSTVANRKQYLCRECVAQLHVRLIRSDNFDNLWETITPLLNGQTCRQDNQEQPPICAAQSSNLPRQFEYPIRVTCNFDDRSLLARCCNFNLVPTLLLHAIWSFTRPSTSYSHDATVTCDTATAAPYHHWPVLSMTVRQCNDYIHISKEYEYSHSK